jgi:hypothetical protein
MTYFVSSVCSLVLATSNGFVTTALTKPAMQPDQRWIACRRTRMRRRKWQNRRTRIQPNTHTQRERETAGWCLEEPVEGLDGAALGCLVDGKTTPLVCTDTDRHGHRERKRERERVCVRVCV